VEYQYLYISLGKKGRRNKGNDRGNKLIAKEGKEGRMIWPRYYATEPKS